jgi:hypothetical protein
LRRTAIQTGDTIANHLSEVTRSHLAAYLKKGGLSEEAFAHMPWAVGDGTLSQLGRKNFKLEQL